MFKRANCERLTLDALRHLASFCDGARKLDSVGFSGSDSDFGRSLAGQKQLSDNQLGAAVALLQKYRNTQLAEFELPTPEDVRRILLTEDSVSTRYTHVSVAASKPKPIKRGASAVETEPEQPHESILELKPWLESPYRAELNEQQQQAFDAAHGWFFSTPAEPFVLIGRAGSGKSFTAQRIVKSIQSLSQTQFKVALTAPTHRARAVLEKFAIQAEVAAEINTVQSLLYLKPGKADKDGKRRLEINEYKWMKRNRDPHWSDFSLIILDECSMISNELFHFIQQQSTPVIFMGESYQLPPVEDDQDAEKLSPVFALDSQIKLTKVMRYDGEIARYVDAMADKIESAADSLPKLKNFETRNGNLIKLSDKQAWEELMLDSFASGDQCRALAWTNARVKELNEKIRDRVMGISIDDFPFVVGDRIMAKEPIMNELFDPAWYQWRENSLMQTCDEGSIVELRLITKDLTHEMRGNLTNWSELELKAISEFIPDCMVPAIELVIECDSKDVISTAVIVGNTLKQITQAYQSLKKIARSSQDEQERKQYWRAYFHMLDAFSLIDKKEGALQRLQFAFASTVHQAQGGTYDYVFCDYTNLMGCRQPFTRDRLIYTASSRAAKQLIAYSKY